MLRLSEEGNETRYEDMTYLSFTKSKTSFSMWVGFFSMVSQISQGCYWLAPITILYMHKLYQRLTYSFSIRSFNSILNLSNEQYTLEAHLTSPKVKNDDSVRMLQSSNLLFSTSLTAERFTKGRKA